MLAGLPDAVLVGMDVENQNVARNRVPLWGTGGAGAAGSAQEP